jgi:hypothetical protein
MNYLAASEYAAFGLEDATDVSWITAASVVVEGYCRRPTLGVQQYLERVRMAEDRNTLRLTYLPLAIVAPGATPVLAARGRYIAPRHTEGPQGDLLGDVASVFALPGTWVTIDPQSFDYFAEGGELSLPLNVLGLRFGEVEVTYTAGLTTIPNAVKVACAQIVRNAQATPALNVQKERLDRMYLQYFSDSLVDQTVRSLLAPYVAQKVG